MSDKIIQLNEAAVKSELKELVRKILGDTMTLEMTQKAKKIYPIENCTIRKVKTVKRPRFDIQQLLSMQADSEIIGADDKKEEEKKATEENLVK